MKIIKGIIYSFFNLFFYVPVNLGIAFLLPWFEIHHSFFLGLLLMLTAFILPIYVAILSVKEIGWKNATLFQKIAKSFFVVPALVLWIYLFCGS